MCAASPISRNLSQQIRRAHWLAQSEIAGGILLVAWLPACHDADAQCRSPLTSEGHEVPSAAIGETDVRDEHFVVRAGLAVEPLPRLLERLHRLHLVSVGLEERLHELPAVGVVFDEQDAACWTRPLWHFAHV